MKDKISYTGFVLLMIALILFTNTHFLYCILYEKISKKWFGITVNIILVDFVLYLAVFLQILGILIILDQMINLYLKLKKKEENNE